MRIHEGQLLRIRRTRKDIQDGLVVGTHGFKCLNSYRLNCYSLMYYLFFLFYASKRLDSLHDQLTILHYSSKQLAFINSVGFKKTKVVEHLQVSLHIGWL